MTLGDYLKLTNLLFGEDSPQHKFIAAKIASSRKGEDDEVLSDESQMMLLFASMTETKR